MKSFFVTDESITRQRNIANRSKYYLAGSLLLSVPFTLFSILILDQDFWGDLVTLVFNLSSLFSEYTGTEVTEYLFFRFGLWAIFFVIATGAPFFFLMWLDIEAHRKRTERRVVKGTKLLSVKEFNQEVKGDGFSFPHQGEPSYLEKFLRRDPESCNLAIRRRDENGGFLMMGDSGTGKTTLIHALLHQFAERQAAGEKQFVVVYDPSLDFWQEHGRPERGDILFYPMAEQSPYWDLPQEITSDADSKEIAASFLPENYEQGDTFWVNAPRQLLSFLLRKLRAENGTIEILREWLSNSDLINEFVLGTELEPLIAKNAAPQRAGVLGSMNKISDSLFLLPPADGRERITITKWSEASDTSRWIFIGNPPPTREAFTPLLSALLDVILIRRMRHVGGIPTRLVVDELHTLKRLPKLRDALYEIRKYNGTTVIGTQGRSQVVSLYRHDAEAMLSNNRIRLFGATKEGAAAQWCADNIGRPVQEQVVESYTSSAADGRDSINSRVDRQADYIVQPNEIQNLPDLTFYLRYMQYVTKFSFPPYIRKEVNKISLRQNKLTVPTAQIAAAEIKGEAKASRERDSFFEEAQDYREEPSEEEELSAEDFRDRYLRKS